jgi:hypothetical protein|tara:strand:+ start:308 stop:529 length:222 start_codon:yes stop_codon:yes gene_type:complete
LLSDLASAQAIPSSLNDSILTLPVVTVLDQAFQVVFQIVENGSVIDLELVDYEEDNRQARSGTSDITGVLLHN